MKSFILNIYIFALKLGSCENIVISGNDIYILYVLKLVQTHEGRPRGLEVRAPTTDCGVLSMCLTGDLCYISLFPVSCHLSTGDVERGH